MREMTVNDSVVLSLETSPSSSWGPAGVFFFFFKTSHRASSNYKAKQRQSNKAVVFTPSLPLTSFHCGLAPRANRCTISVQPRLHHLSATETSCDASLGGLLHKQSSHSHWSFSFTFFSVIFFLSSFLTFFYFLIFPFSLQVLRDQYAEADWTSGPPSCSVSPLRARAHARQISAIAEEFVFGEDSIITSRSPSLTSGAGPGVRPQVPSAAAEGWWHSRETDLALSSTYSRYLLQMQIIVCKSLCEEGTFILRYGFLVITVCLSGFRRESITGSSYCGKHTTTFCLYVAHPFM